MTAQILAVRPLIDLAQRGHHHPRSQYVDWYWLPTLGPTATLCWGRLATMLHDPRAHDGYELDMAELRSMLGVVKPHLPENAIDRLCRFDLVRRADSYGVEAIVACIELRSWIPTAPPYAVAKLPERVRLMHREAIEATNMRQYELGGWHSPLLDTEPTRKEPTP